MKIKTNYIAAFFLLGAAILSFIYHAYSNLSAVDGLIAPVIVNIEVAKTHMNNYGVIAEPDSRVLYLAPTGGTENDLQNAVVFTEISGELVQKLFVKSFDKQNVTEPLDSITVFTGNKTFYYPKKIIETWSQTETEDGALLRLPVEPYAKSIIKPWINWYGDLNWALKTVLAFLVNPLSFYAVLLCVFFCVILAGRGLQTGVQAAVKNYNTLFETGCLFLLLLFAFLLRFDGLTRHSSWADELYSSTIAANPRLPWFNSFKDPGNPPLFFLLLRLWHEIFGWSEFSGRMLSALIGTAGIVPVYCFVKPECGRKYAFLSALLLTISLAHIGYSNQIRAYVLMMALAPVVSRLFFCLVRKSGVKQYALYVLAGAALVNTHYYGILLIAFNFCYYVTINRKQLCVPGTLVFLAVNVIIALSLLPFFVITAFQKALLDSDFNTFIRKPGKMEFAVFAVLFLMCLALPVIKRRSPAVKNLLEHRGGIFEYTVYAVSFIYIAAYIVSLKRPILTLRYLSICLPFVFSAVPVVIFNAGRRGKMDVVIRFLMVIAFINISSHIEPYFGGGFYDIYKEAQEYISADAAAHSLRAAGINDRDPSYYNLVKIPPFTGTEAYDVVYVNPIHTDENKMLRMLSAAGLDNKNILRIRIASRNTAQPNERYILKKYLNKSAR